MHSKDLHQPTDEDTGTRERIAEGWTRYWRGAVSKKRRV
jgi:hypothetical protein